MSKKKKNDDCGDKKKFFHENALCRYELQCEICHLVQPEADTHVVNKLYVEQRVKTLMNQQKKSDKRLTSFKKDEQALQTVINVFQRAIIKAKESKTTTNNNECQ